MTEGETAEKKNHDMISAAICASVAGYAIYLTLTTFVTDQAAGGGPFANSAFYPQLLSGVIIFLSILMGISSFIKKKQEDPESRPQEDKPVNVVEKKSDFQDLEQDGVSGKTIIVIASFQIIYTVFLDILGYLLITPFFMAFMFRILKVRSWLTIATLSLASTFTLYYFFALLLDVILPESPFTI
ncbi:MAG: tripartite tricarboxylate transporter TctB family protein [Deltaproteobacteria bacterium]|nr:tripartite tricarboxylate transporter TctB family protein [Deltaproteobacteria bacterium]